MEPLLVIASLHLAGHAWDLGDALTCAAIPCASAPLVLKAKTNAPSLPPARKETVRAPFNQEAEIRIEPVGSYYISRRDRRGFTLVIEKPSPGASFLYNVAGG
ncbi:hypothetical protein [Methylocystis parvus]|uniref:hypothetical protein n=1 Tax=Methylocystis parvus TaxID=134 RepID=UPI003C7717ED